MDKLISAVGMISQSGANRLDQALYPLMFAFQCHMITRIDDVSKVQQNWIKVYQAFGYYIQAQLPWSKKVGDPWDLSW